MGDMTRTIGFGVSKMASETAEAIRFRQETQDTLETFNRLRMYMGLRDQIYSMWYNKMNQFSRREAKDMEDDIDISDIVSSKRAYLGWHLHGGLPIMPPERIA